MKVIAHVHHHPKTGVAATVLPQLSPSHQVVVLVPHPFPVEGSYRRVPSPSAHPAAIAVLAPASLAYPWPLQSSPPCSSRELSAAQLSPRHLQLRESKLHRMLVTLAVGDQTVFGGCVELRKVCGTSGFSWPRGMRGGTAGQMEGRMERWDCGRGTCLSRAGELLVPGDLWVADAPDGFVAEMWPWFPKAGRGYGRASVFAAYRGLERSMQAIPVHRAEQSEHDLRFSQPGSTIWIDWATALWTRCGLRLLLRLSEYNTEERNVVKMEERK